MNPTTRPRTLEIISCPHAIPFFLICGIAVTPFAFDFVPFDIVQRVSIPCIDYHLHAMSYDWESRDLIRCSVYMYPLAYCMTVLHTLIFISSDSWCL